MLSVSSEQDNNRPQYTGRYSGRKAFTQSSCAREQLLWDPKPVEGGAVVMCLCVCLSFTRWYHSLYQLRDAYNKVRPCNNILVLRDGPSPVSPTDTSMAPELAKRSACDPAHCARNQTMSFASFPQSHTFPGSLHAFLESSAVPPTRGTSAR